MKKRTECSAICGDCGSRAEEENAGMRTGAAVRAAFTVCLAVLLLLCGAGAVSAAPSGYWTDHAANDYAGGDGSETNPYNISRPEEFALFAKQVNANLNTTQNFTLTSNIDLSAYLWEPIGNVTTDNPTTHIFQGTFDSGNHTISNMNVTKVVGSDCIYAGLFGCVKDAMIKNVTLTGVVVNVTPSGDGNACSGGLAGYAIGGSITNCCATGDVSASGTTTAYSGGLVGSASSSITNCCVTGSASGTTTAYSGGLAGYARGSITNSTALNPWVNATGDSSLNIGRAVGQLWTGATVSDCYAWRHMGLNI
ncbi:MAG TPA: hypothetical protein O0X38_07095, partial [Methanocorpusculum sp.]|nr:hypothetical protein [Methanocorpusculum sp.]